MRDVSVRPLIAADTQGYNSEIRDKQGNVASGYDELYLGYMNDLNAPNTGQPLKSRNI